MPEAAVKLATAYYELIPSMRGSQKAISAELGGLGKRGSEGGRALGGGLVGGLKGSIGPIAGLVAGAFAVDKVSEFFKSAVDGASDLQQNVGGVEAVMKAGAKSFLAYSKTAATSVGISASEYDRLGTLLGSQLKNGGVATDQLASKTKSLISTGADLSAMFGGSAADAVDALSSALKGERDPIERYGVSLNQAKIDAEAASLGFQKVGGSLSTEANQAATLSLIMKQTADAHGAFARENDTLAHKQQVLNALWKDGKARLGTALLPAVTSVTSALIKGLGPALTVSERGIKTMISGVSFAKSILLDGDFTSGFLGIQEDSPVVDALFRLREGAIAAGTAIPKALGPLASSVKSAFGAVASTLGPYLPAILSNLRDIAPQFITLSSAASPFGIVLKGLAPVLPQIVDLVGQLGVAMSGALAQALPVIVPLIVRLAGALAESLSQALPVVLPMLGRLASTAVNMIVPLTYLAAGVLKLATPILASKKAILLIASALVIWKATMLGISFVTTIAGLVKSTIALGVNTAAWVRNTFAMLASKAETVAIVALYAGQFVQQLGASAIALGVNTAAWVRNTFAVLASKAQTVAIVALYAGQFVGQIVRSAIGLGLQTAAWVANTAVMVGARIAMVAGVVATGAATAAQWLFNAALSANPIGIVIVAIAALVAGLVFFFTKTKTGQKVWAAFTGALVAGFNIAKAGVVAAVNFIGSQISARINAARVVVLALVTGAKAMAAGVGAAVTNTIKFFTSLKAKILGAIGNAGSWLLSIGKDIVSGLSNGISNAWGNVTALVSNLTDKLPAIVKKALGIHSPSRVMMALGRFVGQGFAKGITGTQSQVSSAMRSLSNKVIDAYNTVTTSRKLLKAATATKAAVYSKLTTTARAISAAQRDSALKVIATDNNKLQKLAAARTAGATRLAAANKKLAAAQKLKADYKASVLSGLSAFDTTEYSSPSSLISALTKRVSDTVTFTSVMSKLRKGGLDATTYKQLIAAGVDALPQAQALLAGGKSNIKKIASLQGQLSSASSAFASTAANDLYGAGVNAAKGLVAGIKSQQAAITKTMKSIASSMVASIRKALGIHSPSRVMAELGGHVPTGFAQGIDAKASVVNKSMDRLAYLPSLSDMTVGGTGASTGASFTQELNVTMLEQDPQVIARKFGREFSKAVAGLVV